MPLCGPCIERKGRDMEQQAVVVPKEEAESARVEAEKVHLELTTLDVDADNMALVGEILTDVKKRRNAIEDRLKEITAPLRAAEASARALFSPALNALARAEALLKQKIGEAQKAQLAVNQAAMLAAQTAVARGDTMGAALAAAVLAPPPAPPSNISTREVWTFRVTAPDAVPRLFCSPDEKKIRAFVALNGGKSAIPGVEVTQDVQVTVRGAR